MIINKIFIASGPTEFMTEENSFPLKINGLVPVGEGARKY